MSKKIYGNVTNRFMEGKNYTKRDIQVGDDITMYHWSDRSCYYVTKVIDQDHIFVKEYRVCGDQDKPKGMGCQDWLYFRTGKEEADYLIKYFPDRGYDNYKEYPEEEWIFRYGHWNSVRRFTLKSIKDEERTLGLWFTEKEQAKLNAGKEICKYSKLEPISFGVRDYYFDWTF